MTLPAPAQHPLVRNAHDRVRRRSFALLARSMPCIAAAVVLLAIGYSSSPVLLLAESGASSRPHPDVAAARVDLLDTLAGLVRSSRAVLFVNASRAEPFTDLLLWTGDHDHNGQINRSELLLLSHSRSLKTITLYSARSAATDSHRIGVAHDGDPFISAEDLARLDFCDRWRSDPAVDARVIAERVSDLTVNIRSSADAAGGANMGAGEGERGGTGERGMSLDAASPLVLEIEVIWGRDSADAGWRRSVRAVGAEPGFSAGPGPSAAEMPPTSRGQARPHAGGDKIDDKEPLP